MVVDINKEKIAKLILGHVIKAGKENQIKEVKKRVRMGWMALGKLYFVLENSSITI